MADFNITGGFSELEPLCRKRDLRVMNSETDPTFTFHRTRRVLDVCLCSPGVKERAALKIVPQPYSDHDALLLGISP
jgi:hypothetical protein